jgi:anti-sigma factor RsiW
VITCARFDELHLASLDAPLEGADRATFDLHLASCPACVERLKGYVTTSEILRGLDAAEAAREPAPLGEAFVQRLVSAMTTAVREDRARKTG